MFYPYSLIVMRSSNLLVNSSTNIENKPGNCIEEVIFVLSLCPVYLIYKSERVGRIDEPVFEMSKSVQGRY